MNAKVEQVNGASGADIAKLVAAGLLLLAGLFAFYYYEDVAKWLRILGLLGVIVAVTAIAYFTYHGRAMRGYLVESNFELRKVVWPNKDETIRTTGVILVVVVIISLVLGLIDLLLKWAILDHLLRG